MFVITENSQSAFADFLIANGIEPFRAKQVFYWIYKKSKLEFSDFTNLPKQVVDFLKRKCVILTAQTVKNSVSESDKTKKFLLKLKDSNLIESALLYSEDGRLTACLSTQVGCAVSCVFCASGKTGFKRNLTVSEIMSQYLLMRKEALEGEPSLRGRACPGGQAREAAEAISNIVFMGIGEPLLNYDNLMSSIDLLTDSSAVNIGARHITVSTSGIVPGIEKLSGYKKQINLSISLHSAFDEKRNTLVPINRKYCLNQLFKAVKGYIKMTSKPVTFEYVLIKGMNDTKEDVFGLVKLLKGIDCKINLIPYNSVPGTDFKAPGEADAKRFVDGLIKNKIRVIRRKRRGFDINSGCGQLKAQ